EGMKKTAPDGAVSGMPAIRETGPGKNLQAITVSTLRGLFSPQPAGKIFDLAAQSALLHRPRPAFR
ncbi:hypothetical protein EYY04_10025, partial [Escherichia coli]